MADFASMWYGSNITKLCEIVISSYLKHGHTFTLYSYDKNIIVPEGTIVKDANEILDVTAVFGERNLYQPFSDLFRYKMLMETDYIWTDMDAICLKSDWQIGEYILGEEFLMDKGMKPNNAILRLPKDSPALKFLYENALAYDKNLIDWSLPYGTPNTLGPALLETAIEKFDLYKYVLPMEAFYPIPPHELHYLLNTNAYFVNKLYKDVSNSYTIHVYNSLLGLGELDYPHPATFLGHIATEYGVSL